MLEQVDAVGDGEKSSVVCEVLVDAQMFGGSLWPTIWLSREGRVGTPMSGTPDIEGQPCLWVPVQGWRAR